MEGGVSTYLLTQGVLGVAVLVLGFVAGFYGANKGRRYSIQSGIVSGISSASKLT